MNEFSWSDLFWFVLLCLTNWRISSLLVREEGPGDIFVKFRYFIGVRYDQNSVAYGENVLAKAFLCVWCLSLWFGLVLAFFSPTTTYVVGYFITAFALSAAAIIIDSVVN